MLECAFTWRLSIVFLFFFSLFFLSSTWLPRGVSMCVKIFAGALPFCARRETLMSQKLHVTHCSYSDAWKSYYAVCLYVFMYICTVYENNMSYALHVHISMYIHMYACMYVNVSSNGISNLIPRYFSLCIEII